MARLLMNQQMNKINPIKKEVMRTKFIVACFLASGAIGFSQVPKKALKEANKALKSGNIEVAKEALNAAEGLLGAADDKMKAQYYFLKAQVASSSKDKSLEQFEKSTSAYAKVLEIEKTSGSSKYTAQATTGLQTLRQALVENAIEDQKAGNNKEAADKLYLGYKTSKTDTLYLYYAASNAVNAKDYDTALTYYNELVDLGFNGIENIHQAINKETGKVDPFGDKNLMMLSVKSGTHIKPETIQTPSKKSEITKNIVLIYISQGKDEEAMKAMEVAKKENPEDTSLMQAEADMFYKLGNVAKYKEIVEAIVTKDPNNPDLIFNLGVSASRLGDNEQALDYYKKAIELKPDYGAAQINIASIMLGEEQAIVEEMNGLGTSSSDYKRYDTLKQKRQDLYKNVVPYLEGALKSDPDNIEAVRTLMNIYYQLDDAKAGDLKNKLKALEGGN